MPPTEHKICGFKFHTMTPLEGQVTALGVCFKCHKKTLKEVTNGAGCQWQQCTNCLTIFANEAKN